MRRRDAAVLGRVQRRSQQERHSRRADRRDLRARRGHHSQPAPFLRAAGGDRRPESTATPSSTASRRDTRRSAIRSRASSARREDAPPPQRTTRSSRHAQNVGDAQRQHRQLAQRPASGRRQGRQAKICHKFMRVPRCAELHVFSNTTSAGGWNKPPRSRSCRWKARTTGVHLAVGGFDYPGRSTSRHSRRQRRHGRERHRRARSDLLLPPLLHRLHVLDLAAAARA